MFIFIYFFVIICVYTLTVSTINECLLQFYLLKNSQRVITSVLTLRISYGTTKQLTVQPRPNIIRWHASRQGSGWPSLTRSPQTRILRVHNVDHREVGTFKQAAISGRTRRVLVVLTSVSTPKRKFPLCTRSSCLEVTYCIVTSSLRRPAL